MDGTDGAMASTKGVTTAPSVEVWLAPAEYCFGVGAPCSSSQAPAMMPIGMTDGGEPIKCCCSLPKTSSLSMEDLRLACDLEWMQPAELHAKLKPEKWMSGDDAHRSAGFSLSLHELASCRMCI